MDGDRSMVGRRPALITPIRNEQDQLDHLQATVLTHSVLTIAVTVYFGLRFPLLPGLTIPLECLKVLMDREGGDQRPPGPSLLPKGTADVDAQIMVRGKVKWVGLWYVQPLPRTIV